MMHAHPRVFSRGEVFLRFSETYAGRRRRPEPLRYLQRDMRRAGRRHFLFSVHFLRGQHLRPDLVGMELEAFLDAIRPLGIDRVALLERRNSLRVIVSKHAGELREAWHVRPGMNPEAPSFALDPRSVDFARMRMPLLDWLEEFERGYEEASRLVIPFGGTYLSYEDDVLPDPRIGYRKLCAILDLPPVEVEVPLVRATPFRLQDLLTNYDEIERELRDTRFGWMLENE